MPKVEENTKIQKDSLYKMTAQGATKDEITAANHDSILYG